jgi:hypothetical protein
MSTNEISGSRWRWCRVRPRRAAVLAVTAGVALLTAACGTSGSSSSSTTTAAGSTTSTDYSARLAYAQCVRAHGVPTYPDPQSNGDEPPGTKQLFVNNPRFLAAASSCRHFLPNGGHPTQTPQPNALTEAGALSLAGCMRTHGFPRFPDPTIDSVGQPVFNVQAAGIPPQSQQVQTTLRSCLSSLHLTGIPQDSGQASGASPSPAALRVRTDGGRRL